MVYVCYTAPPPCVTDVPRGDKSVGLTNKTAPMAPLLVRAGFTQTARLTAKRAGVVIAAHVFTFATIMVSAVCDPSNTGRCDGNILISFIHFQYLKKLLARNSVVGAHRHH